MRVFFPPMMTSTLRECLFLFPPNVQIPTPGVPRVSRALSPWRFFFLGHTLTVETPPPYTSFMSACSFNPPRKSFLHFGASVPILPFFVRPPYPPRFLIFGYCFSSAVIVFLHPPQWTRRPLVFTAHGFFNCLLLPAFCVG